jgi:hypothetical protein
MTPPPSPGDALPFLDGPLRLEALFLLGSIISLRFLLMHQQRPSARTVHGRPQSLEFLCEIAKVSTSWFEITFFVGP